MQVKCPIEGCTYETAEDVSEAIAVALLSAHALSHASTTTTAKPQKMERPRISLDSTAEDWDIFRRKWEIYRTDTNIHDEKAKHQLWQCCEGPLSDSLFKKVPNFSNVTLDSLLDTIKTLAVVNVASSVRKAQLFLSKQDRGQPIQKFAAEITGTARICSFTTTCLKEGCNQVVDYSNDIIKHVIISGLADDDIRREVLSIVDLDRKTLEETIQIIAAKEMVARALPVAPPGTSYDTTASSHTNAAGRDDALDAKLATIIPCQSCGTKINKFKLFRGRYQKHASLKEFTKCKLCWRRDHPPKNQHAESHSTSGIASVSQSARPSSTFQLLRPGNRSAILLDHFIFDGTSGWIQRESKPQPVISLTVSTNQADYDHLGLLAPQIARSVVSAVADTGAQSSLMGVKVFRRCGFADRSLLPVRKKMHAANEEDINILGAVFARLSGPTRLGETVETAEMIYVTDSTNQFYLSRHAMEQLGIIGKDFPQIGASAVIPGSISVQAPLHETSPRPCNCPLRTTPPSRPAALPFEPCVANNDKMKQWLLDRFASSTFNKCRHQTLPFMTGPPMAIHVQPDAKPTAVHKAATIPARWQEEVQAQLDTDVRLGVIEKVPLGTPTTWCHRAMWVPKADGTPRRVVDFQSLNRQCARETHHTIPPFKQARCIPQHTFKSVTDAWNGYHSVPVRDCDRELLTFITEFGRYRYRVAPQGFLASGDGYTHRQRMTALAYLWIRLALELLLKNQRLITSDLLMHLIVSNLLLQPFLQTSRW